MTKLRSYLLLTLYLFWPLLLLPINPAVGVGMWGMWLAVQPVVFLLVILMAGGPGESETVIGARELAAQKARGNHVNYYRKSQNPADLRRER